MTNPDTAEAKIRDSKECTKCQVIKPFTEFHRDKTMPTGYKSWCKLCVYIYRTTVFRPRTFERGKTSDKEKHLKNRKRRNETQRARYYKALPKYRARQAVNNAVSSGKMSKQPCNVCGKDDTRLEFHHHDYSKENWLNGVWLCPTHHKELHRELKMQEMIKQHG